METLTNDKATLEVQLATQVRQQAPEKSGSGEQTASKQQERLFSPAEQGRPSSLLPCYWV